MARKFSRGNRVGTYRRATSWLRSPLLTGPDTLAAASAVIDSLFITGEPTTIIRIRGAIAVTSDQFASSETWIGAVGVCVVSDQANAIGVTAVPTPVTDADSDLWMMHQYFQGAVAFSTAAAFDFQRYTQFPFDSKAMRKMNEDESLLFVVENSGATQGLQYILQYSVLFKHV